MFALFEYWNTAKAQAVGLNRLRKEVRAYAHYSDLACVWFNLHINHKEKKQQPPLWQVTVV